MQRTRVRFPWAAGDILKGFGNTNERHQTPNKDNYNINNISNYNISIYNYYIGNRHHSRGWERQWQWSLWKMTVCYKQSAGTKWYRIKLRLCGLLLQIKHCGKTILDASWNCDRLLFRVGRWTTRDSLASPELFSCNTQVEIQRRTKEHLGQAHHRPWRPLSTAMCWWKVLPKVLPNCGLENRWKFLIGWRQTPNGKLRRLIQSAAEKVLAFPRYQNSNPQKNPSQDEQRIKVKMSNNAKTRSTILASCWMFHIVTQSWEVATSLPVWAPGSVIFPWLLWSEWTNLKSRWWMLIN